jgi:hypothetical protein
MILSCKKPDFLLKKALLQNSKPIPLVLFAVEGQNGQIHTNCPLKAVVILKSQGHIKQN